MKATSEVKCKHSNFSGYWIYYNKPTDTYFARCTWCGKEYYFKKLLKEI